MTLRGPSRRGSQACRSRCASCAISRRWWRTARSAARRKASTSPNPHCRSRFGSWRTLMGMPLLEREKPRRHSDSAGTGSACADPQGPGRGAAPGDDGEAIRGGSVPGRGRHRLHTGALFPDRSPGAASRMRRPVSSWTSWKLRAGDLVSSLLAGHLDAAILSIPRRVAGTHRTGAVRGSTSCSPAARSDWPHSAPLGDTARASDLAQSDIGPLLTLGEGHCLGDQVLGACSMWRPAGRSPRHGVARHPFDTGRKRGRSDASSGNRGAVGADGLSRLAISPSRLA